MSMMHQRIIMGCNSCTSMSPSAPTIHASQNVLMESGVHFCQAKTIPPLALIVVRPHSVFPNSACVKLNQRSSTSRRVVPAFFASLVGFLCGTPQNARLVCRTSRFGASWGNDTNDDLSDMRATRCMTCCSCQQGCCVVVLGG